MKAKGAVFIAIVVCMMLGVAPAALAGGASYENTDPHQTGCDAGAVDVPSSVRSISIDGQAWGELVVRASTACPGYRWSEVRFSETKGYTVVVKIKKETAPTGGEEYSATDKQSPIWTNQFNQSEACITYGAVVTNSKDGSSTTVSEQICETNSSSSSSTSNSSTQVSSNGGLSSTSTTTSSGSGSQTQTGTSTTVTKKVKAKHKAKKHKRHHKHKKHKRH